MFQPSSVLSVVVGQASIKYRAVHSECSVTHFFYSVIDCMFCLFHVQLCVFVALLYLDQVAVVNENLFSTSLPGSIKVNYYYYYMLLLNVQNTIEKCNLSTEL